MKLEDPELKIQTFYPTWEEFKDFNNYIKFIETKGAHKAGLARIIPPKEWIPRKDGLEDLSKLNITIRNPICQAVAKISGEQEGAYQQVNVPQISMTVPEFRDLCNTSTYTTPSHTDFKDLERLYWENMIKHAGIYGADVCGSITDTDQDHWNISRLGSILDFVSKDYNLSIDGVNTAYLYFGMWKTTFAWHTEDMDLYSINYLHTGAPKTWYSIPPSYGRKFEKLAAKIFPKSAEVCKAFLRHKMTIIDPRILADHGIPYDSVTQESGHIMITFPFGYHAGFNHGFNIAESTNFAIERWVQYGKHSVNCNCCPDAVRISMDAFVKRFQPELYDAWKEGKDMTPHPEYPLEPKEEEQPSTQRKKISFKERNPELNIQDILDNQAIPFYIREQLKGSFLVSADEEVAGLIEDYDEAEKKLIGSRLFDDSSDEDDRPKNRRRKKHDSDYDDDWFESKGGKVKSSEKKPKISTGKYVPTGRPRGRPFGSKSKPKENVEGAEREAVEKKKRKKAVKQEKNGDEFRVMPCKIEVVDKFSSSLLRPQQAKSEETSVKSKGLPYIPPPLKIEKTPPVNASRSSYSDAFAAFLGEHTKAVSEEKPIKATPPPLPVAKVHPMVQQPPQYVNQPPPAAPQPVNRFELQQQQLQQPQQVWTGHQSVEPGVAPQYQEAAVNYQNFFPHHLLQYMQTQQVMQLPQQQQQLALNMQVQPQQNSYYAIQNPQNQFQPRLNMNGNNFQQFSSHNQLF